MKDEPKEHKDYLDKDFEIKPVLILEDENSKAILHNPLYEPIVIILRKGYMSLKDIKDEYRALKGESSLPSDKSLYRHLKYLKEAGLIAEVGRRGYKDQTSTEKLFARTAHFFYTRQKEINIEHTEENIKQAKLLGKLLQIMFNIPKPSVKDLLEITDMLNQNIRNCLDELFEQNAEKMVELFKDASSDDVQMVVEFYRTIKLLTKRPEFDDVFKRVLKYN